MKQLLVLLLVAALATVSCSEAAPVSPDDRSARAGTERDPGAPGSVGGDRSEKRSGAEPVRKRTGSKKDGPSSGPSKTSAGLDPNGGSTASQGRTERPGGGHSETSGADRPGPRSGRFTYAQQGWEEFCSGTCRRRDLPPSQEVDATVSPVGSGRSRIVTESRASEDRSMRTTALLSRRALDITKVELRYGTFSNTYEPSPPVRSLRLPLAVGDAWTSSWRADTSGRYEARVVEREPLVVDGRRVRTFKVATETTLRGEFRGTLTATIWVDPGTAATVRTSGTTKIRTDLGRFASEFDTMLVEGPDY